MAELMNVGVRLEGFDRKLDFDKKQVRAAMKKLGGLLTRDAKKLVSIRAISGRGKKRRYQGSAPGEFPRKLSGKLSKTIKYKVSKPGFLVRAMPKPEGLTGKFYPAFLHYGVTGKPRRQDHKAQDKDGSWRIAPRKNYMAEALRRNEGTIKTTLHKALINALKII